MCGIAGVVQAGVTPDGWRSSLRAMSDRLAHRGPDDEGQWFDPEAGVGLAHRRLAVVDLSPTGRQPMRSTTGRYVVTYNGEIYNYVELRAELLDRGRDFRGESDTEVLLVALEEWGLLSTLGRLVGMFAFAVWDRRDHILYLARDRLGEKPLYYGWQGDAFLFASELKALRAHPSWAAELEPEALALYLRHGYVPAPRSIFRRIRKLLPGSFLAFPASEARPGSVPDPTAYWSLEDVVAAGHESAFDGDAGEATDALEALLRRSVDGAMRADVPLGAFLSGGTDSSVVVALMRERGSRPVDTFTVGFHSPDYDEAGHARAVAAYLGTDHHEITLTPAAALELIPHLPELFDEPLADESQIPTHLVSRLARERVVVALSGDGGDEVFGGYTGYLRAWRLWRSLRWIPAGARTAASRAVTATPVGLLNAAAWWLGPVGGRHGLPGPLGDKLHKLAPALPAESLEAMYRRIGTLWHEAERMVHGAGGVPDPLLVGGNGAGPRRDGVDRLLYMDARSYLPDDILVKLDRASMAWSLETRVPLLDHRVVEFAWRLPVSMKIRRGTGKWILRRVLDRHVPRRLVDRPKKGFGVPIGTWLRGPLREWAEALVDETSLRGCGLLDPAPIRRRWLEHLSGRRDWRRSLWTVLAFQAWWREWARSPVPAAGSRVPAAG